MCDLGSAGVCNLFGRFINDATLQSDVCKVEGKREVTRRRLVGVSRFKDELMKFACREPVGQPNLTSLWRPDRGRPWYRVTARSALQLPSCGWLFTSKTLTQCLLPGLQGRQPWALILSSSARVSTVTYEMVIAVRYPELDSQDADEICFGAILYIPLVLLGPPPLSEYNGVKPFFFRRGKKHITSFRTALTKRVGRFPRFHFFKHLPFLLR